MVQYFYLPTIRAAVKLRTHDPGGAIEALRPALKYDTAYPPSFNSLYPAYIRGQAYLQMGEGRSASVEFQKLLDHPGLIGRNVIGALSYLQMARAQKIQGNITASQEAYEHFLSLWKGADPHLSVYVHAKAEYASLLKHEGVVSTKGPSL
jgi:tetratricopeptide (TPR) repeat protein